jgi:hypothetical protein
MAIDLSISEPPLMLYYGGSSLCSDEICAPDTEAKTPGTLHFSVCQNNTDPKRKHVNRKEHKAV